MNFVRQKREKSFKRKDEFDFEVETYKPSRESADEPLNGKKRTMRFCVERFAMKEYDKNPVEIIPRDNGTVVVDRLLAYE